MEDAKTIVDSYWHQYCQMKDWIGQAWFCATLQLFDFSLFGCHIFLRMRKSQKIRSARTWVLFSHFFRSSIDWWWENERWLVAGNYTVKQNLLHLYIVRCCNSLLIVFHGCEDYRRLLMASILPDEGLDWFCAPLQLFDFSLFGCHIFLRMRKSQKIRSARTWVLFSHVFRSSIDWWWENERWLVAGNYTVKQNLLHVYIVRCCNSLLIVFHGGCEDDCRFLLASILPDEGLDWTSMILCNSATLWFFTFWMPHFPQDAEVAKNSICEDMSPIFLCFSVIYRLVVREWEVVGSGKLYSQTESSSSIYCSLLQFLACLQRLHGTLSNLYHAQLQDAKTMVESYWRDFCEMKKDRIFVTKFCFGLNFWFPPQDPDQWSGFEDVDQQACPEPQGREKRVSWSALQVLLIPRIHLCIGRPFRRTISFAIEV